MTIKNASSVPLPGRAQGLQEEQTDCHNAPSSLQRRPQEKAQMMCSYRFNQTHIPGLLNNFLVFFLYLCSFLRMEEPRIFTHFPTE